MANVVLGVVSTVGILAIMVWALANAMTSVDPVPSSAMMISQWWVCALGVGFMVLGVGISWGIRQAELVEQSE